MASPLKSYLGRSIDLLRRSTAKVVKMDATPQALPTTIFSFESASASTSASTSAAHQHPIDDVTHFSMGADSEVGGLSTCNLSLIPSPSSFAFAGGSTSTEALAHSHLAFYGNLSTRVPPSQAGKIRTGYAGFRNTSRPTLFGQDNWDLELYTHLKIKVGYRGWEGWRNRWVVNIGIDGRPRSDVFQHRLEIPPSPSSTSSRVPLDPFSTSSSSSSATPKFTTVYLPLSSFVLIKKGQIAASPIPLPRSSIRTVGFALLGRDRGDDGPESKVASAAQGLRSLSMGGWGKASSEEAEDDPELKALLEQDQVQSQPQQAQTQAQQLSRPAPAVRATEASRPSSNINTSGYHRAGSGAGPGAGTTGATAASPATTVSGESEIQSQSVGNDMTEEREGYYELCLKSVEAVKWDPEADGPEEA